MAAADPAYQHTFGSPLVTASDSTSSSFASTSPSPTSSPSLSLVDSPSSSTTSSPASLPDLTITSSPPRRSRFVVASFFSRSSCTTSPPKQKVSKKQKSKLKLRETLPETPPVSPFDFQFDQHSAASSSACPVILADPQLISPTLVFDDIFQAPPATTVTMQHQVQRQQQQHHHTSTTTPAVLNRPRRILTTPTSSTSPRQQPPNRIPQRISQNQQQHPTGDPSSIAPRGRTASWSSSTTTSSSFDTILFSPPDAPSPSGIPRPRSIHSYGQYPQMPHQQPLLNFAPSMPLAFQPGQQFAMLPGEILELILDELKKLHLRQGSDSCSTCWTRDLCAVALSSRKWSKFARTSLYEDIQIVGCDSPAMKKRYKIFEFPRLALLRRTLRSSQQIAVIVKTLRVPILIATMNKQSYYNTVASVIMACPNFERLVGLYPAYDHSFNRLFHALSTRSKLKQMEWIIEPAAQRQTATRPMSSKGSALRNKLTPLNIAPTDLNPGQSEAWLDLHIHWRNLATLTIHAMPGGALTPDYLIAKAIKNLPKLQHLFLSNLSYTAFKDDSLLALPPLKTLSLNRLNGISGRGLSAYAARPESHSLTRLELRHVNIDTITPLCRLLATCKSLHTLIITQSSAPVIPAEHLFCLMPYTTSNSLRFLHWDITASADPTRAVPTDSIIARSIAAGGFPALRTLRTPHDPEGIFQTLCRVYERVDTPSDRFRLTDPTAAAATATASVRSPPATPTSIKSPLISPTLPGMSMAFSNGLPTPVSVTDFGPGTPGGMCSGTSSDFHLATNLADARRLAQARLENARRFPRFFAHVIDDRGRLAEKIGLGGFLGELQSQITYSLLPDAGASDAAGGLLEVSDLLAGREAEGAGVDVCTGRWNMAASYGEGGRDRERERGGGKGERWYHVERPRWTLREL